MTQDTSLQNRIAVLARMDEVVFHADDLANLWQIQSKNTLYTTLRRYVDRGVLHRIFKGYYALMDPMRIDPELLGTRALHGVAYVSTETVLVREGWIQQHVGEITLVGAESRRFTIAGHSYRVRQLADQFLYNTHGIKTLPSGARCATPLRALADLLYFNSKLYLDGHERIDWDALHALQTAIGYPITRSLKNI